VTEEQLRKEFELLRDNPELRAEFNQAGYCELCLKWFNARDCHHLMTRRSGQVDIRCNLIGLCRLCHIKAGQEPETIARVWEIVLQREGRGPTQAVWDVRRMTFEDYVRARDGLRATGVMDQAGNDKRRLIPPPTPLRRKRGVKRVEVRKGGWRDL
jgi:hypothetical protein